MMLIADSGSTKTDWCFVDNKRTADYFTTSGINPYFHDEDYISNVVRQEFPNRILLKKVRQVFFYGAGCSSPERNSEVKSGLKSCLSNVENIHVEHDLLGAARALCGHKPGFATILGTGSNACYYNGKKITSRIGGYGYILGDEGSGVHLGKALIQSYLYRELPTDIHTAFEKEYHISKEELIQAVYSKPNPNRYLASFAPFLRVHIEHEFIKQLVYDCFELFLQRHVLKLHERENCSMHVVGSIGFHFAPLLKAAAMEKNIRPGKIIKAPLKELVQFHASEIPA